MRIEPAFQGFHERNPIVYKTLVDLAREAKRKGRRQLGIAMLWERMRWELMINTDAGHADLGDDFKLNNNYRSRYARLIMSREPDLDGFFTIRRLHDEDR